MLVFLLLVFLTRSQINNWMITIEKSTDRKRTLRCPVFVLRDGASLPHRKGVVCVSPQVLAKVDAVCEDVRHFRLFSHDILRHRTWHQRVV